MFSLIKGFWNQLFQKPNYKILIIGLDKSGKTCLLNSFKKLLNQKYTSFEKISPTIGLNIAQIEMDNSVNTLWDLGGQKQLRKLWQKYINDCDSIIYCIDCSLSDFQESVEYLVKSVNMSKNTLPVLLFLNKQDLLEKDEEKLTILQKIKQEIISQNNQQYLDQMNIEFCSAIKEQNLIDPLIKLNESISQSQVQ